jgi:hypothetical protein
MSGWQLLGFESFEDYGFQRFGYEKSRLHQLARAQEVQISLCTIVHRPIPESQLRPLSQIPAEIELSLTLEPMGSKRMRCRLVCVPRDTKISQKANSAPYPKSPPKNAKPSCLILFLEMVMLVTVY